jgi:hypothetical protein
LSGQIDKIMSVVKIHCLLLLIGIKESRDSKR